MSRENPQEFDVIVIGAGMGGLYALYRLRQLGFHVHVLEQAPAVGGTWYWNSYPGCRVDIQAVEYSFSFSKELEQEWDWTETMATQPELERYLNYIADRFDLRRDIQFDTAVVSAVFDEIAATWMVVTQTGERFVARYVVAATGALSVPLMPRIEGIDDFEGVSLHTGTYPKDGFDFTGKRVAVIGTGSSGVQAIPVVAQHAAHVSVLQRSAAFTRPAGNRPISPEEMQQLKREYPDLRRQQLEAFAGTLRFGALSVDYQTGNKILETSMEDRLKAIDEFGWDAPWIWADTLNDPDANRAAVELYSILVHRAVRDPETADALIPSHPLGCKRPILDTGYFDAYNHDNIDLVDLQKNPIERITPTGIQTQDHHIDLDVIIYATGFDAMTGALSRIDVRGRGGVRLGDLWSKAPATYLGLQVAGFPNFFTVLGAGSPSVHVNMVMAIEQHVDWIGDCLVHLRDHGKHSIEATDQAQAAWVDEVASLVNGTVRAWDSCNSWYLGANVPGKPRVYLAYTGGFLRYRAACAAAADAGYREFIVA